MIEELALAYDYGFTRLTESQKTRWKAFGEQVISNLWSPDRDLGRRAGPLERLVGQRPRQQLPLQLPAGDRGLGAGDPEPGLDRLPPELTSSRPSSDYYAACPAGAAARETATGPRSKSLWENTLVWNDSTGEVVPTSRSWRGTRSTTGFTPRSRPATASRRPATYRGVDTAPLRLPRQPGPRGGDAGRRAPQARRGIWWIKRTRFRKRWSRLHLLASGSRADRHRGGADRPDYHATGVGEFFAGSSGRPTRPA